MLRELQKNFSVDMYVQYACVNLFYLVLSNGLIFAERRHQNKKQ